MVETQLLQNQISNANKVIEMETRVNLVVCRRRVVAL
jgi:hypothetical protein